MNDQTQRPRRPCCRIAPWLLGNRTTLTLCRVSLLPLRLMVGVIFAFHGLQKVIPLAGSQGFDSAMGAAGAAGLRPTALWAVLLIVAELGGGLAIILGVATRLAAAMTAIVMIVALVTVHSADPFTRTHGQQMLLVGSVVLIIAGGGVFSLIPGGRADAPEPLETQPPV